MVGTARVRSEPTTYAVGASNKNGYYSDTLYRQGVYASCDDVIGNRDGDNPFDLQRVTSGGFCFNGDNGTIGIGQRSCYNYPMIMSNSSLGSFSTVDLSALATTLTARTNPGRAHIQLPVALFELRDLPRMVKLAGDSLLTKAASANLSWQFGWKPLISDVKKLFDFTDATDRRVDELNRLNSKGGLRRRMRLSHDTYEMSTGRLTLESYMFMLYGTISSQRTREIWGTIRWVPTHGTLPKSAEALRSHAKQLVLGLDKGQIITNLWDALPWSWLIDWFTNVGDFIRASNNSVGQVSGAKNIMVHTIAHRTYHPELNTLPSWCSTSGAPWMKLERKQRFATTLAPSLNATLPFLSGRQLSILGSLAVLRKGRYRHARS